MKVRCRVAGVTFAEQHPAGLKYPDDLFQIAGMLTGSSCLPLHLEREPNNPQDSNAVSVRVPSIDNGHIGYLPKRAAAVVAKHLKIGRKVDSWVERVLVNDSNPTQPGLEIVIEIERGNR